MNRKFRKIKRSFKFIGASNQQQQLLTREAGNENISRPKKSNTLAQFILDETKRVRKKLTLRNLKQIWKKLFQSRSASKTFQSGQRYQRK